MWFFRSPHIVFGEDALSYLEQVEGQRGFIVTDAIVEKLGFARQVQEKLEGAGMACRIFSRVEPDPCLQTVRECAEEMRSFDPDWVVGLGGGSCMDAAKAAWFLFERPDVELEAINPVESFGLRNRAKLITIPTTAGSGSEVSWAAMISDTQERRKLELATYEFIADLTIVDPAFSSQMPPQLTADTGIDALTHAVEAYNNAWSNDFSDGLCLQAARLVFTYLPRAVADGSDGAAREKMANAATLGGLVITNTNISIAHALGHSAGALFHLPHGRVTGLILPLTVEYLGNGGAGRYTEMAHVLGLCPQDAEDPAGQLAEAIRELLRQVGQPLSLKEMGVTRQLFDQEIEALCDRTEMDAGLVMAPRIPDREEMKRLFECAFDGSSVDF